MKGCYTVARNSPAWGNWTNLDMDEQKKFMILLGWAVIECKCIYYMFSGNHPLAIKDYDYDMLEKKYEAVCRALKEEPSASDMVDFDMSRPSCQSVYEKLTKDMSRTELKRLTKRLNAKKACHVKSKAPVRARRVNAQTKNVHGPSTG